MRKSKFAYQVQLLTIIIVFISCNLGSPSGSQPAESFGRTDTVIVKHENSLTASYEVGFYAKSYTYYWIFGKDTSDFSVNATELVSDSTLHLSIYHKVPVFFKEALRNLEECFPYIEKDFDLSKMQSLYFTDPIYYFELVRDVSTEYEKQFGHKNIDNGRLNHFLLNSDFNKQLDSFVSPLGKKIKRYGVEKFHLTAKNIFSRYFPTVDLSEYPEFAINGIGFYIQIENKSQNE